MNDIKATDTTKEYKVLVDKQGCHNRKATGHYKRCLNT